MKFEKVSNHCRKVFEGAKLVYANKTKESLTSQKVGSWDFWQLIKVLSTKEIFTTKKHYLTLLFDKILYYTKKFLLKNPFLCF